MNRVERIRIDELQYRPEVDGIRFLAVFGVLIYHFFKEKLLGGFLGVDVFFVISGYLITQILLSSSHDIVSMLDFICRRINRLVPSLLIILLASLILGWFFLLPEAYMKLGRHVSAGAGFYSNIIYLKEFGYFDADAESKVLLHLWSLGVEGQFYLTWAIIFILFSKVKKYFSFVIIMFFLFSMVIYYLRLIDKPSGAFYLPDGRMWEMFVGAIIAQLEKTSFLIPSKIKFSFSFFGVLFILIAFFCADINKYLIVFSLMATFGAGLVLLDSGSGFFKRFISNNAFVFLGKISYPLYLWHWVILSYSIYIFNYKNNFTSIICLMVSVVLAILTYTIIEVPLSRIKFQNKYIKPIFLITSLIVLWSVGFFIHSNKGLGDRQGYSKQAVEWIGVSQDDFKWSDNVRFGKCHIQLTKQSDFSEECVENGAEPLVILWGDSHASSLYPGLLSVQQTEPLKKFRIGQLTSAGCPPLIGVNETQHRKNCADINNNALEIIRLTKPKFLLIHAHWGGVGNFLNITEEKKYLNATVDVINQLQSPPKIIIIGPVPVWIRNLPEILANIVRNDTQHNLPPERISGYLNPDISGFDEQLGSFAKSKNLIYISPFKFLCQNDECVARVGSDSIDSLSFDKDHLSKSGSIFVMTGLFNDYFK